VSNPLDQVRVVLSHPSHPGNIGAAARALKTMGLSRLYLVNPRKFPHPDAKAMASGALNVLNEARVCASLDEALAETVLAAAISARQRELTPTVKVAREAAQELVAVAARDPVALVFGTEMSGLNREEVARCQMLVHIPANPEYSSLNLAAAVQVLCYELRMVAVARVAPVEPVPELARLEEVELFYQTLEQTFIEIGFLDPEYPRRLMPRLRRLFSRTRLEREELNLLMGILKAVRNS
jgi:tRNA/rRNA methyltransferase